VAALAKTIGAILAILGLLLLLAGLGAAAYGFYDMDKHRNDLFRDQDREEADQALMVGGAAAASAGLVLFLAGLITLLASRPKPTVPAAQPVAASSTGDSPKSTPSRAAPAPRDSQTRNALLAGSIAVLLVGLVVAGLVFSDTESARDLFGGSAQPTHRIVYNETFEGTVQGGSSGVPGAPVVNISDSNDGQFTPPADAAACTATLTWTPSDNGAAQLRLRVQRNGTTVADGAGAPGFSLTIEPTGMAGAVHDYAVFPPPAPGIVNQGFTLRVVCTT